MKKSHAIINFSGWAVFFLSLCVYSLTTEPTASLWDCGELIASAYKLQVPHPPGAPFYLLTARVFSLLAFGNVEQVAFWVNWLSALSSAFTILFLFWTIILIIQKLTGKKIQESSGAFHCKSIGAAAIGALSFAFSDTFWFSAVEAEVYALSSFLFILSIWMILKWDLKESAQEENRWIILIAFVIGLSAGVHLLNLLVIPALGVIIYYKKWRSHIPGIWGVTCAILSGVLLLVLLLKGVYEGIPMTIQNFELFFVNTLGTSFGTGFIAFLLLLVGLFTWGIFYTIRQNKHIYHTALLCFIYLIIGYSSYTIIFIRAGYDPPINQNSPDNILSLASYIQRDQYGSNPVFFGPLHTAQVVDQKKGEAVYVKGASKYEHSYYKSIDIYDSKGSGILPRMWSQDPSHKEIYAQMTGLSAGHTPHLKENLVFFLKYQVKHMYWRYFMWNFSGRESDLQNAGFLLLHDFWKKIPEALQNKATNNFLMLPLLLGISGFIYNVRRNRKHFYFLAILFFLTGICLVFYLNPPPNEPRERDYIYFGSFMIFSIWIGLGALQIISILEKWIEPSLPFITVGCMMCLSVPGIMLYEGWDDHDRSNRHLAVDAAKNKLNSCTTGSVLFTSGDNDAFPLWYLQEVEGFRKDVRIVVLSYLNADWYIRQLGRASGDAPALTFNLSEEQYRSGGLNDELPYIKNAALRSEEINLKTFLKLVKNDNPSIQIRNSFRSTNTLPGRKFYLDADQESSSRQIPDALEGFRTSKLDFELRSQSLEKKELMLMDFLIQNDWKIPVYFSSSALKNLKFDFEPYVVQEGLTYRFLPVKIQDRNKQLINTEVLYENLMNRFKFTNTSSTDVYYDSEEYISKNLSPYRRHFNSLAMELIIEGEQEKARKVLLRSLELFPDKAFFYDYYSLTTLKLLNEVNEKKLALDIALLMAARAEESLDYLSTNPESIYQKKKKLDLFILKEVSAFMKNVGQEKEAERLMHVLTRHLS